MRVYFPYEKVRAEQAQLIKDVMSAVSNEKIFLAHAPTGLGKTASSLAPALSYALQSGKKVFFLTPKISQHEIVLETANLMNEEFNLGIKAVDLVGRKQMCVEPFLSRVGVGFYEACAKRKKDHACMYYENTKGRTPKQKAINARRKREILTRYNMPYSFMKEQCRFKSICPYEITLEMIKGANLIIGDYSHLFHPEIREGIMGPAEISFDDIIVIVDEAHNLPDRLRDMLSISIDVNAMEKAEKEAKSVGEFEVEMLIKDLSKEVVALGKKLSLERNESSLQSQEVYFFRKISANEREQIAEAASKFMTKNKTENCYLLALNEFIYEFSLEKEHTLYVIERKTSLTLTVQPLDAAELAFDVLPKVHSAVLMSGTLLPLDMFSDVLGVNSTAPKIPSAPNQTTSLNPTAPQTSNTSTQNTSASLDVKTAHYMMQEVRSREGVGGGVAEGNSKVVMKEYKSPFPKENRLNLIVDKTTTKYTQRNDAQLLQIAEEVDKIIAKVPGNTIVFFPSFDFLQMIAGRLRTRRQILRQEREMSQDEKTKLVNDFKLMGSRFGGVLLAVSGGSIAEGLDFPGDYLSCAIIVGIPFAKVNIYSNAMINYCEQKFRKGWDYAYNAPAINKAMQAAGRVIRTETDRGVCIFLDERFAEMRYKKFYPKDFEAKHTKEPAKEVEEFFNRKN